MYLLRSVDGSLARSSSNLLLYGKLGPIVLVSGLRLYELKGMKDAQVRRRGSIRIAQDLRNTEVKAFVFLTRPNEVMSRLSISEKQSRKIAADYGRKVGSAEHLHSVYASESDLLLRERRRRT
jgi:hypothetical protein